VTGAADGLSVTRSRSLRSGHPAGGRRPPGQRSSSRLHAVILAGIGAALTALLSSAPAFAASGQITGTLTDQSGAPVAGMSVYASTASNSVGVGASNDASGHYVVGGLDSGTYRVHFYPPGSGPNFLGRFYAGETASGTADLVTVADGRRPRGSMRRSSRAPRSRESCATRTACRSAG
jgi:carboxypeptidase family protein